MSFCCPSLGISFQILETKWCLLRPQDQCKIHQDYYNSCWLCWCFHSCCCSFDIITLSRVVIVGRVKTFEIRFPLLFSFPVSLIKGSFFRTGKRQVLLLYNITNVRKRRWKWQQHLHHHFLFLSVDWTTDFATSFQSELSIKDVSDQTKWWARSKQRKERLVSRVKTIFFLFCHSKGFLYSIIKSLVGFFLSSPRTQCPSCFFLQFCCSKISLSTFGIHVCV
jgi:hypothetical protein